MIGGARRFVQIAAAQAVADRSSVGFDGGTRGRRQHREAAGLMATPELEGNAAGNAPISSRGRLYSQLLLLLLIVAAFAPACGGEFTDWDDNSWVGANRAVNPPTLSVLADRWRAPYIDLYSPLAHTAWYLVAKLTWRADPTPGLSAIPNLDPAVFHALGLTVHLAAVAFAYAALARLFRRAGESGAWPAFLGAAVFALHPIVTEAVAWISGLKDVLCTAAMAAGLWTAVGWAQADRARWRWLAGAILALAVALLSKPTAVMLPLMWGVTAWAARARLRSVVLVVAGGIVSAAPVAYLASRWQGSSPLPDGVDGARRGLVALGSVGFYLGKVLWPFNFTIDYGRSPGWTLRDLHWLPGAAMLAALAIVAAVWRDRRFTAGAALFVLPLLPVSGLRNFDFECYSVVADHYAYPAMLGIALIAGRLALATQPRVGWRPFAWASVSLGLALGVLTFRQSATWKSAGTLYEHGLAVNPASSVMNNNLGQLLYGEADYAGTLQHARRAIETWPTFAQPNYLAGLASLKLHDPHAAIRYLRVASPLYLGKDPQFHAAYGDAYAQLGRYRDAAAHYRFLLRMKPNSASAALALREMERRAATQPTTARATTTRGAP